MDNRLQKILSSYNFTVKNIEKLDKIKEVFKITDDNGINYFLKIYDKSGGDDIIPGENIYYTYEQISVEMEILNLLSDSALNTAVPIRNSMGEFVTVYNSEYATITSFIDAPPMTKSEAPMTEKAFLAGVAAAKLHLESEKKLLPVAVKRQHKRQDYIKEILNRLKYGLDVKVLTDAQFEMLKQCCDVIIDSMNKLDEDPAYNIGLVHTDIRPVNCTYSSNQVTFIDFSRSVYSYYLYDLGHIFFHADWIGSHDIQSAVLRGYHSVKPLKKDHLFMTTQVFTAMFLLTVMASCIDIGFEQNAWMQGVLKWFTDGIHPGLMSGKGYLDSSVFKKVTIQG